MVSPVIYIYVTCNYNEKSFCIKYQAKYLICHQYTQLLEEKKTVSLLNFKLICAHHGLAQVQVTCPEMKLVLPLQYCIVHIQNQVHNMHTAYSTDNHSPA